MLWYWFESYSMCLEMSTTKRIFSGLRLKLIMCFQTFQYMLSLCLVHWYIFHDPFTDHQVDANGEACAVPEGGIYEDVEQMLQDGILTDEDAKSAEDISPSKRSTMLEVLGRTGSLHRALWCEMPEVRLQDLKFFFFLNFGFEQICP